MTLITERLDLSRQLHELKLERSNLKFLLFPELGKVSYSESFPEEYALVRFSLYCKERVGVTGIRLI